MLSTEYHNGALVCYSDATRIAPAAERKVTVSTPFFSEAEDSPATPVDEMLLCEVLKSESQKQKQNHNSISKRGLGARIPYSNKNLLCRSR
jgi:hypothetical protein